MNTTLLQLAELILYPGEVSFEFKGGVPSKKKGRGLSRADKRLLVARKFSAKRKVYENCRMLSQDGSLLCFCDMRKVRWYEVSPRAVKQRSDQLFPISNEILLA